MRDGIQKFKSWMNENAPTLTIIYDNKYVGMAYDRFASLPPRQQKQAILGGFGAVVGLFVLYILSAYWSLWGVRSQISDYHSMITLMQQYQKVQRDQGGSDGASSQLNSLARPGAFKDFLVREGQKVNISSRLIKVEEKPDSINPEGEQGIKIRQATVNLERVNLTQLRRFLTAVEFGGQNVSVSSIRIVNETNDDLRGYMNVDLGVVAYLLSGAE